MGRWTKYIEKLKRDNGINMECDKKLDNNLARPVAQAKTTQATREVQIVR